MKPDQSQIHASSKPAPAQTHQPYPELDAGPKPRTSSLEIEPLTAIIAFESLPNLNPAKVPEIGRFHLNPLGNVGLNHGTALGRTPGTSCALVLAAQKQDLVCIRELPAGGDFYSWRYYRIDDNFQPRPLAFPNRSITHEECRQMLGSGRTANIPQVDDSDSSLRIYLDVEHPPWLAAILSSQADHWRKQKFEKFLRLAPNRATTAEIERCVASHPFLALAHLKALLSATQLATGVRRTLKGAVIFAFDQLTPARRSMAMDRFPVEMIRHATVQLTDKELRTCAQIAPGSALLHRRKLSGYRRALLLAHGYPYAFVTANTDPLPDLGNEVLESLATYPAIWIDAHQGDFGAIIRGTREELELEIPSPLLVTLLQRLEGPYRDSLAVFLAKIL